MLCRNQKEVSGSMRVEVAKYTKCYQKVQHVKCHGDLLIRKYFMPFEKAVFQASDGIGM